MANIEEEDVKMEAASCPAASSAVKSEPLVRPPGMPMFHTPGRFPLAQTPAGGSAQPITPPKAVSPWKHPEGWKAPPPAGPSSQRTMVEARALPAETYMSAPVPARAAPDIGVVSVTLSTELMNALLVKAEEEAASSSSSTPMYLPGHAQAVVEQLATSAVAQSQLNKARLAVGAPTQPIVPPPKAAPALLRSMIAASLPERLERTPQLPAVPWSRAGSAAAQANPNGSGIRPLDTGRLKMDAAVLTQLLTAALSNSEHPTTMAIGCGKALTFCPPVFRDRMVSRYCELDYEDPRAVWIKQEKQLKWVCAADDYGIGWLDNGSAPWRYREGRLIQQADGSFSCHLTPIISRVHWLYQRLFEWNCDLTLP